MNVEGAMADHWVMDRWGNTIELTDERWQHIATWHADMAEHLDAVLETIRHGRREQDAAEPARCPVIGNHRLNR